MKTTVFALLLSGAAAFCPNACSGHGRCGQNDKCECYDNYQGSDCSERTCSFATSWGTDLGGHSMAECSDRGQCNRDTGLCECNDGYTGKGCRRMACVEGCSGHGTCETLSVLAAENSGSYTGWDANMIQACKCDPGYSGIDCASRMCIPGDDPMSLVDSANAVQVDNVQTIVIEDTAATLSGDVVLRFTDWRGEKWETYPITIDPTATTSLAFEEALEALPNHAIPDVTVGALAWSADAAANSILTVSITFVDGSNSGSQVLLEVDGNGCDIDGCQPRFGGVPNVGGTTGVTQTTAGTKEKLVCSGRGTCDTDEGLCECHDGYYGQACEHQTIIM